MGKVYSFDEYEEITRPPGDSARVWRYMDLPRFASMLVERALHFTKASVLRTGLDRFEGVWPEANVRDAYREIATSTSVWIADQHIHSLERHNEEWASKTYVNCWHINEDESYAMWKAYAAEGPGIAIQTTFGRLNKCMAPYIFMYRRKVAYIDNKVDGVPRSDPAFFFLQKRRCFSAENELRLLITEMPAWEDPINQLRKSDAGVFIPVNVGDLAEKIYVSPYAGKSFMRTVTGLLQQFGLSVEVSTSTI